MDKALAPAPRLTLSRIVEMLLTRNTDHSSVSLTRNAAGDTQIEVTVRTGDDDTPTVEEAEAKAAAIFDRLASAYPVADGHEASEVALTRNARGETQIAVTVKSGAHSDVATLDAGREKATEVFRTLRGRFPLSTGKNAGMVAAAPDGGDDG